MADLERPKIKVGFIPIIDCAAIVLAEELGAYERQGLEVEIRREVSWANVRDKLALGALDASHILAPLPLALTLGIDSVSVPVINAMTLRGERQRAHPVEELVAGDGRDGAAVRRRRPYAARRARHRRRGRQAGGQWRQAAGPGLGLSLLGAELHAAALAVVGRPRSRSRRPPRRCAAAPHRRLSLGRRDRRLLRRRALEPAVGSARHRPHRAHRPGHLEGHAGEGAGNHRVRGRRTIRKP